MKKFLKVLLIIVVVIIAVFFVGGLFLPKTYDIKRSKVIAAPDSVVYATISDMSQFQNWSPWAKIDPNVKNTIGGNKGQVGSFMSWKGNSDVGSGKMTITSTTPNKQ